LNQIDIVLFGCLKVFIFELICLMKIVLFVFRILKVQKKIKEAG